MCVCLCVRQKASHEPTNRTEIGLVLYSSCMKVLFIIADIWEKDNTNNIAQQIFCFFKHSLRVFIDFSMSFAHFFPSFRAHWDLVIIVTCFFSFSSLYKSDNEHENPNIPFEDSVALVQWLGIRFPSYRNDYDPKEDEIKKQKCLCVCVCLLQIHTYKFKIWMPERQAGHWRRKKPLKQTNIDLIWLTALQIYRIYWMRVCLSKII